MHQQGFSSYDRLESIRESLEGWVEPYAAELETEITSGEFTQEVCEEKAARMYEIWDGQLNDLWDCLGQRLDAVPGKSHGIHLLAPCVPGG